ncbi:restriction endonuclease [Paenibacillus lutrae]|uniref:Restriction endonuclease n=1 Tax=Paenibacillus lutrae TaxID=2078573 RepID=A0A7X3FLS4_9BACL|nr:restriction endonuclease [Paenibacillus lutrae]MVP02090.1 restriction endonuclease [Paenibacillus lutrae]
MSKRKFYKQRKKNHTYVILLVLLFFISVLNNVDQPQINPGSSLPILNRLSGSFFLVPCLLLVLYFAWSPIKNRIKQARRKKQLRMSGIYTIDRMTGSEFENYLTVFFEDLNYRVEDTGGKGDRGADKILIEPSTGMRICVQAKCWSKNVTFEAVQQIFTAKTLWGCDKAWIITNRGFTKQVKETAEQLGIELWDREKLIENMYQYNKAKQSGVYSEHATFYSSPESRVFHDDRCEYGRKLAGRSGALVFEGFVRATESGRRKCNCFK